MIEHEIDFITKRCEPAIVIAEGKDLAEGKIKDIKKNEDVIEA